MNIAMKVFIDNVPVDPDFFSSLNMADVGSVEVLRTGFFLSMYGSQAPGGALLINTKRGNEDRVFSSPAPGIMVYSPKGYYKTRVFYSPQYDDPKTNIPVANLRSTIYWNPNIITDKNGAASFEFFNAGSKGTYRVIIEGIDDQGNIGRQVYRYKVE